MLPDKTVVRVLAETLALALENQIVYTDTFLGNPSVKNLYKILRSALVQND